MPFEKNPQSNAPPSGAPTESRERHLCRLSAAGVEVAVRQALPGRGWQLQRRPLVNLLRWWLVGPCRSRGNKLG